MVKHTLDTHLWVYQWLIFIGGKKGWIVYVVNKGETVFYSKWQKQLDKISQYWRKMADQLANRSDEGALTDSQDEIDHGVWPTYPNVLSYKK